MDNITPHYVNLGILKFPDKVKFLFLSLMLFRTVQFYTTLFCVRTTMKAKLRVISLAEQVYIPLFRSNIKKFSPTFTGRHFPSALGLQSLLIPVLNARLT